MTITTANDKSPFRQIWVTRNGLSTEQPAEQNRFTSQEAEIMADEIYDAFGNYLGSKRTNG